MRTDQEIVKSEGIRFSVKDNQDEEIGHAFLYLMHNDLHEEPFGLLEDVFIDENYRGQGVGTNLIKEVIKIAEGKGCYKLVATSRYERPKVHDLYKKLGFKDYGVEFKMEFK